MRVFTFSGLVETDAWKKVPFIEERAYDSARDGIIRGLNRGSRRGDRGREIIKMKFHGEHQYWWGALWRVRHYDGRLEVIFFFRFIMVWCGTLYGTIQYFWSMSCFSVFDSIPPASLHSEAGLFLPFALKPNFRWTMSCRSIVRVGPSRKPFPIYFSIYFPYSNPHMHLLGRRMTAWRHRVLLSSFPVATVPVTNWQQA